MKRRVHASIVLLLVVSLLGMPMASMAQKRGRDAKQLGRHLRQGEGVTQAIQQVVGPMPGIAIAPFLGLAALSGLALLADTEYARTSDNTFVRAVCDNSLVREAQKYSSLTLFLLLCGLALLTYLASSGKIRGIVGKMLRATEDGVVTPTYALLSLGAFSGLSMVAQPAVAEMGFSLPSAVLLAFGVAFGLAAMMTVRFAFDVLIWLSPVPFIDFLFETAKNVFSVGLLVLYLFFPGFATAVAVLFLAVSLLLYGWAIRIVGFAFQIVLRPVLARLVPSLRTRLLDEKRAGHAGVAGARIATPAAALAVPGFSKRQLGTLFLTTDGLSFSARPLLGRTRQQPLLLRPDTRPVLCRCLFWYEVRVTSPEGRLYKLALPKTLQPEWTALQTLLAAEDAGAIGGADKLRKLADRMGEQLKGMPPTAQAR
ncbi:MAG TPA: hypothetical protein VEL74_18055 [Thermoanaerobaculia bacterium]|nr:hypothetical protein [Thermoanaerobaculia bacterium]